jgi:hypothetical protein
VRGDKKQREMHQMQGEISPRWESVRWQRRGGPLKGDEVRNIAPGGWGMEMVKGGDDRETRAATGSS